MSPKDKKEAEEMFNAFYCQGIDHCITVIRTVKSGYRGYLFTQKVLRDIIDSLHELKEKDSVKMLS